MCSLKTAVVAGLCHPDSPAGSPFPNCRLCPGVAGPHRDASWVSQVYLPASAPGCTGHRRQQPLPSPAPGSWHHHEMHRPSPAWIECQGDVDRATVQTGGATATRAGGLGKDWSGHCTSPIVRRPGPPSWWQGLSAWGHTKCPEGLPN